jgi:threonine aldolase
MDFRSDNTAAASAEMLAALAAANIGRAAAYGDDQLSQSLDRRFSDAFEKRVRVFPVATGTAANALSLAVIAPPYGAIYCHVASHIAEDECNAPEFYTGGAKLVGLEGAGGQIDPVEIERRIATATPHGFHNAQPAAVSVSQTTELGTVYAPARLRAIADVAHRHGLKLHMDGARLANAAVALDASLADLTWRVGVDILSFGATKNGAIAAEAVVVFDPVLAERLPFLRKRGGQLLSKMRFAAAQLAAYLDNDLWRRNARHANAMAVRMAEGLSRIPGVALTAPVEANALFPRLPQRMTQGLLDDGALFAPWGDPAAGVVRLVTAFSTTPEEVDRFIARARHHAGHV